MAQAEPRESMDYDVVIVGGGPSGLSAAIRLKQLAAAAGTEISICLIDKGAEIGAHILSGAILDPSSLLTLIADARDKGAPLDTPVCDDRFYYLAERAAVRLPNFAMPPPMHNKGAYIVSLGNLCRWLGHQAEALGVEIYPGFAAVDTLFDDTGALCGIVTGDVGVARDGTRKTSFAPGMALMGKYVLLAEGARGFLSENLIAHFDLRRTCDVQKYGLGIKELWSLPPERHRRGQVVHTVGWPLDDRTGGGLFLYHWGERYCSIGLVLHLNYRNPFLSPFEEFQRAKQHPLLRAHLEGGKRVGYGARVVTEGGLQSVPQLAFAGGALIGAGAGFMNVPRIKGIHNAIASGMLAADGAFAALNAGRQNDTLSAYQNVFPTSSIHRDLAPVRNVKPLWSRLGTRLGVMLGGFDMWCQILLRFSPFGTLHHDGPDHAALLPASACRKPDYPKADEVFSFDRLSSVYLSNTSHEEDQPVHLHLADPAIPLAANLPKYDEPARHFCPAGVYDIIEVEGVRRFQIDAANCLHCKACEIKDPSQNITWTPPQGAGGPNYADM
jgi:electron-transferring-flavoprotein dehydrogenase